MITETDLLNLGYRVWLRQTDKDKSVDFQHEDRANRTYLVNLCKGEIHIDYPTNVKMKKPFFRTASIAEFTSWHTRYKQ
jgi:hypothetical protein